MAKENPLLQPYGAEHVRETIRDCNKAIGLDPDIAGVPFDRGLSWAILKDREDSIQDVSKATEPGPECGGFRSSHSVAKQILRQNRSVVRDCDPMITLDSGNGSARSIRSTVKSKPRQYRAVIEYLDSTINPENADACEHHGPAFPAGWLLTDMAWVGLYIVPNFSDPPLEGLRRLEPIRLAGSIQRRDDAFLHEHRFLSKWWSLGAAPFADQHI